MKRQPFFQIFKTNHPTLCSDFQNENSPKSLKMCKIPLCKVSVRKYGFFENGFRGVGCFMYNLHNVYILHTILYDFESCICTHLCIIYIIYLFHKDIIIITHTYVQKSYTQQNSINFAKNGR